MTINKLKKAENGSLLAEIREKLGLTQAEFAAILGTSRANFSLAEAGSRALSSASTILINEMYLQFRELASGSQADYRSLETRLFLNAEYKKLLPEMSRLEKDCRRRLKEMKDLLLQMKKRALETEHAIIVITTAIAKAEQHTDSKQEKLVAGLKLFKQKVYNKLLTCWEPEQAKLHCRIEAAAGEARALRRYRLRLVKERKHIKG